MKDLPGDECSYCAGRSWRVTATLISCNRCGVVYGRVNGIFTLDPTTVPKPRKPYEPPAIIDSADFETLALSCAKTPGPEPDCHGPGGTPTQS